MRSNPGKSGTTPPRKTRSTTGGASTPTVGKKESGGGMGRPRRAVTSPPKPKPKPSVAKKKVPPVKQQPKKAQQQQQQQQAPKKPIKKEKETRDHDESGLDQPVEVVIQVKNQKITSSQSTSKKTKKEPAKKGVASGKVGKRKDKNEKVKKENLKKVGSAGTEKVENIVQVNVYTKVIPSAPKADPVMKAKPSKAKKDKDDKKKPESRKDIRTEKEVKLEKIIKTEKDVKTDKKIEKEKKIDKEAKEEKIKKDTKEQKVTKECIKEIVIKQEPEEESRSTQEKSDFIDIVTDEEKEIVEEKKKATKSKKSKETKQSKKAETASKVDTAPERELTYKPKIKLEKISPLTIKEEDKADCYEFSPSPKAEEIPKGKKTKQSKAAPSPKPGPSRKKPAKKPAKKIIKQEEPPVVIEKRHSREASLNALAKVHCLYENESRGAMNDMLDKAIVIRRKEEIKVEKVTEEKTEKQEEKPSRNLRSAPGMRGMGRYWDTTHIPSSSSSSSSPVPSSSEEEIEKREEDSIPSEPEPVEEKPTLVKEPAEKKTRKRRKRCEVRMDLKDMVVTKRMASLNASAMMAASYSVEKRGRGDDRKKSGRFSDDSTSTSAVAESSEDEVILSGASKKMALIMKEDSDLTITGLFSTTRSTRREGFCSIAGMQYRISSTSHTQTEATAVSTETVIHTTDHVSVSHSVSTSISVNL